MNTTTRIHHVVRAVVAGVLLASAGLAVACGDDDNGNSAPPAPTAPAATQPTPTQAAQPASPAAQAKVVSVVDSAFSPATLTVARGEKVTWNFVGSLPHSVVGQFAGQTVRSETMTSGSFEFTFETAGTFSYQCGVHGAGMAGTVTVQ